MVIVASVLMSLKNCYNVKLTWSWVSAVQIRRNFNLAWKHERMDQCKKYHIIAIEWSKILMNIQFSGYVLRNYFQHNTKLSTTILCMCVSNVAVLNDIPNWFLGIQLNQYETVRSCWLLGHVFRWYNPSLIYIRHLICIKNCTVISNICYTNQIFI